MPRREFLFQSTLPRGERHARRSSASCLHAVSIHAPARGATLAVGRCRPGGRVSIHAPARGATSLNEMDGAVNGVFQSTLPRGERRRRFWWSGGRHPRFNPRSRAGSDAAAAAGRGELGLFQSTLPRGERPSTMAMAPAYSMFQSTLPRGERRSRSQRIGVVGGVSIHAPARGATNPMRWSPAIHRVSIHAPARGATALHHGDDRLRHVSIHAPARGATCRVRSRSPSDRSFNPRSRAGSDAAIGCQS